MYSVETTPTKSDNYIMSDVDSLVIHDRLNKLTLESFKPVGCHYRTLNEQITWSPYAKAKLRWFRDNTKNLNGSVTEFTCYGVLGDTENMLFVSDIIIPKQRCETAYVSVDTGDLSDIVDQKVMNEGLNPWQVSCLWIHTHPAGVNSPSSRDFKTFDSVDPELFYIMYIMTAEDVEFARMKVSNTDTVFYVKSSEPAEKYEPTPEDIAEWNVILLEKINDPEFVSADIEDDNRTNMLTSVYYNTSIRKNYSTSDNYYKSPLPGYKSRDILDFDSPFYPLLEDIESSLCRLDEVLEKPNNYDLEQVFVLLDEYLIDWYNKVLDKYENQLDNLKGLSGGQGELLDEELDVRLKAYDEYDDINHDIYGKEFQQAFESMDSALSTAKDELFVVYSDDLVKKETLDERK